ncbi:MAG: tetratricopeptide repeat protein [Armatimonadia bacterium]|nr:tetratricopeptide repeat protein [Armatimonadia bacterium]
MSIVKMRKMVRKQLKIRLFGRTIELGSPMAIIFWIIVIIFFVGTYYMYGGGGTGGGGPQGGSREVTPVVAVVNGHEISRTEYETRLAYAESNQRTPLPQVRELKTWMLDVMIDNTLLLEAARAEGVEISQQEIEAEKDDMIQQIMDIRYADKRVLRDTLEQENMSLERFKEERLRAELPDEATIRTNLLFDRLREQVEGSVAVTDEDIEDRYREVKVRHIIIQPEEFMPDDEEETEGDEAGGDAEDTDLEAEMTPEEARAKAEDLIVEIKQKIDEGKDFGELAREYSHGPSADYGGDLGWIGRDSQFDPVFKEAAFELDDGEVSDMVETSFGLHIIKVDESRVALPEDYEENSEQYREQLLQERKQQAWQDYQERLRAAAEIEVVDPELKAYELLEEDPQLNAANAAEMLAAAANGDPYNASARFTLANLLKQGGQNEQAIEILNQLTETRRGSNSPHVYMELATLSKELGRNSEALAHLQKASEYAQGFDFQNYIIHMQAQKMFEEMDKPELAEGEQAWMNEYMADQQQSGGLGGGMGGAIQPIEVDPGDAGGDEGGSDEGSE